MKKHGRFFFRKKLSFICTFFPSISNVDIFMCVKLLIKYSLKETDQIKELINFEKNGQNDFTSFNFFF